MRISTSMMFDRPVNLMQSLSREADGLQVQIATGKKLTAASQDAAGWQKLDGLKRAQANDSAFAANIKLAQTLLDQSDSTLGSVDTQLQRARELALQASNGTVSDDNRQAITAQLDAIVQDLLGLANTKDVRGAPLFGGADGDAAFTQAADGTISYGGTGSPPAIPISGSSSIHAGDSGDRVFGGIETASGTSDVFAIIQKLSTALKSGEDVDAASAEALDGLDASIAQIASTRASVGARGARLELEADRLTEVGENREAIRSEIEEVDLPTTIAELQKTLTVLQATQSSFTKLSNLSLFNYIS